MATLLLKFVDVYQKVGKFLGQQAPSAAEIVEHKNLVYRGYRRFLMPMDLSTNPPRIHKWKFLELTTTLSTESGTDTYKLPLGFSSFVTPFTYTTPITCNPVQKPLSFVLEYQSKHTGTGYPMYFALKSGDYNNLTGQQYEVVFAPIPSGTFNYYYTYAFTPPSPVNDDDVFVGDELVGEAIMECSLAVAELEKDDGQSNAHAKEAERIIQQLIGRDKQTGLVRDLGQMTNGKSNGVTIYNTIFDQNGTQVLPAP